MQIRSVSSLSPNTALVRFSTARTDPGARSQVAQHWAAIVSYRFTNAEMSAADRLTNPLGFQVTRYRRDAETLPETLPEAATGASPAPGPVTPRRGVAADAAQSPVPLRRAPAAAPAPSTSPGPEL